MKADASGAMLWSRLFGSIGTNCIRVCVRPLSDGGYILAEGATFLRTDAAGNMLWQRNVEPVADYEIYAIEPTSDGQFLLGGCYYVAHPNNTNAWLLKTGQLSAAPDFVAPPSSFSLTASPNPFNPSIRISFSLEEAGKVRLDVFDMLGRQISALKDGFMLAGDHAVTFEGVTLSAGIYFARLTTPHRQATLKLMLIK
jgi:hypothetical protein